MSREFLQAYLEAQAAHKAIHRLTKGFESGATDDELRRLARDVKAAIAVVNNLVEEATR